MHTGLIARLREEATQELNHETVALLLEAANALATQPTPVQAVVWSDAKQAELNDWFLSLPEGRRAVLLEDKWMLAGAAFLAGKSITPAAPVQPIGYVKLIDTPFGRKLKPVLTVAVPVGSKLYTTPQLPIKPIVEPGLDANQKLAFKLGWKSAEEAHNITKGQQ
jgi:hypothetical protein